MHTVAARVVSIWLLALGCAWSAPPGAPWRPELGQAFEAYYSGNEDQTRQLLQERMRRGNPPEVIYQARLLETFVQFRSSLRDERANARVALYELTRERVAMLELPETQLALGRGFLGLAETSNALAQLDLAVRGFASQGRVDRELVALAELAKAWTLHTEWERPPQSLGLPIISGQAAQERVRREQLARIRAEAAALPGHLDALQAMDLATARYELSTEGEADARRRLQAIVNLPRPTDVWGEAVLLLADLDATQAEVLLDALARNLPGGVPKEQSRQAQDRLQRLRTPQLQIEAPRTVRPGQPFRVAFEQSRLAALTLELRKLDLPDWLTKQQGRLLEGALPGAGSLVVERVLNEAERAQGEVDLRVGRGAYVLLARGQGDAGETLERKRLVVVSDLDLSVVTGVQHAVAWSSVPNATATFWAHGAFVGRKISLRNGVARFAMPPERAMLSDDRWVCLLEHDGDLTLCSGRATRPARNGQRTGGVALTVAPQNPRAGETISVYGLYVSPGRAPGGAPVTLELLDVQEEIRGTQTTTTREDGSFLVRFRLDEQLGGETVTIRPAIGGRRIETLYRRPRFTLPSEAEADVRMKLDVVARLNPDDAMLEGVLRVTTPSGVPLAGGEASVSVRAVRLPDADFPLPMAAHQIRERMDTVNPDGSFDFAWPLDVFGLPDGPLAVDLRAGVSDWSFRRQQLQRTLLRHSAPVHIWWTTPAEVPVGKPVALRVAWSDPQGLATSARPDLLVRGADGGAFRPSFVPTPSGLYADDWIPSATGRYTLEATQELVDGSQVRATRVVDVVGEVTTEISGQRTYQARWSGQGVDVVVQPPLREPAMVLVDDGEPLATALLEAGASAVTLPLERAPSATGRIQIATAGEGALRWLAEVPIARGAERVQLEARLVRPPLGPGRSATVEISGSSSDGGRLFVTARLVVTDGAGVVPWLPTPNRSPDLPALGQLASGTSLAGGVRNQAPPAPPLHPDALSNLFEGNSAWLESRRLEQGVMQLRVPMPQEPGRFLLLVSARTPDGARSQVTLPLSTAELVALQCELPRAVMLGDRFQSLAVISNPGDTALEGVLQVEPGRGLALLAARTPTGDLSLETGRGATRTVSIRVEPGAAMPVSLQWEAIKSGRALAKLLVRQGNQRLQVRSLPYGVEPDAVPGGVTPLRRQLYRVQVATGVDLTPQQEGEWLQGEVSLEDYERVALAEDEPVAPGSLILVVEEWDAAGAYGELDWRQRMPGNARSVQAGDAGLRPIGVRLGRTQEQLRYVSDGAGGGLQIHEYVLVADRPGVCQLPLPEAVVDGAPLRWEASPIRVVVPDPAR